MQSSSVLNVHLLGLFNDSSKAAFTLDPACRGEKKTKKYEVLSPFWRHGVVAPISIRGPSLLTTLRG